MIAELKRIDSTARPTTANVPQLVSLQELAKIWELPYSWLKEACRSRCADPLPTFKMGRYHRVDLADPSLAAWLARRRVGGGK
jgi:hypothetical protein